MRDPMTFETRLADAFDRYTDGAPRHVDARSLAAELAAGGRGWRGWRLALPTFNLARFGGVRLALVLGLLALASVASLLFAGGFLRPDPAPLGADGRILVRLQGSGMHLLRDGVEVPVTDPVVGAGCPVLLATADAIAVRDRWKGFAFREFAGGTQSQWFNPNLYTGFERWSPGGSALAMVDMEREASVITFPDGDFVNPTVTRYPIVGAIDGFFSEDGSRLAIPVAAGADATAIHVLEGGTDTVVATVPSAELVALSGSWSPDGECLVTTTTGAVTGLRLTTIDLRDGSVFHLGRPDGLAPDASLVPLAWSANGWYLIVGSDSGAAWVLDVGRVRTASTSGTSVARSSSGTTAGSTGSTTSSRATRTTTSRRRC